MGRVEHQEVVAALQAQLQGREAVAFTPVVSDVLAAEAHALMLEPLGDRTAAQLLGWLGMSASGAEVMWSGGTPTESRYGINLGESPTGETSSMIVRVQDLPPATRADRVRHALRQFPRYFITGQWQRFDNRPMSRVTPFITTARLTRP